MDDTETEIPSIELPNLPAECSYTSKTKLKTMIDGDLKVCNMVVAYHLEGWKQVKNVRDIIALSNSTVDILKLRRELSLKPQNYDQILKRKALNLKSNPALGNANADRQLTYEPLE